jgi:hypothetical protein
MAAATLLFEITFDLHHLHIFITAPSSKFGGAPNLTQVPMGGCAHQPARNESSSQLMHHLLGSAIQCINYQLWLG